MFLLAFVDVTPPTSMEYQMFLSVLGELGRLVMLSMCLERALAFIFEHQWYAFLAEKFKAQGYSDAWIKALAAFGGSYVVCVTNHFDVIATLFNRTTAIPPATDFGIFLTALIAAGGSAGAISLFQGFLNISKDSRDAVIATNKAIAETAKYKAEMEALKLKPKADAARKVAETEAALKKAMVDKDAAAKKVAETAMKVTAAEAAKEKAATDSEKTDTAKALTTAQDEAKKASDVLAAADKSLTEADAANKAAIAAKTKADAE